MRFRTNKRPRGVLRASDQRRLSLVIAGFGLILLCISVVRNPAFWKGMFPDVANQSSDPEQSHTAAPNSIVAAHGIQHDEFLTGNSSAEDSNGVVSVTANRVPLDELTTESETKYVNGVPRVPNDLLRTIRDDVIGVHSTESEAYFAAMKMAARFAEKTSVKVPNGAYALFMDSPGGNRGTAWNIEGKLRRLSVVRGRSNAFGVGLLYDAWISTHDSGDELVHVVAMKSDSPLGSLVKDSNANRTVEFEYETAPPVKFTGYFFKREGYASQQGISLAPLFVAGTLHDVPVPVVQSTRAEQLTPYLGWLALFICAGILFMIWGFAISDGAHAQTRSHQLTRLPAVASFDEVTSMTIPEALGELEMATTSSDASSFDQRLQ